MNTWVSLTVGLLIAGLGISASRTMQQKTSRILAEREPLTDDEIFHRFYTSSSLTYAKVIELWHEIADALNVPSERMRPGDRFGKDVGAYWLTSEALDALGVRAQQRARRQNLSVDLTTLKTVDDYVRCFARTF